MTALRHQDTDFLVHRLFLFQEFMGLETLHSAPEISAVCMHLYIWVLKSNFSTSLPYYISSYPNLHIRISHAFYT